MYAVKLVAPLAGAWIEIFTSLPETVTFLLSLPSRERGLKFDYIEQCQTDYEVAPLAGAWIEIKICIVRYTGYCESLPSRERGLKSYKPSFCRLLCLSLPSRERGLKFC